MRPRTNITGLLAGLSALGCAAKPTALPPHEPPAVAGAGVVKTEDGAAGRNVVADGRASTNSKEASNDKPTTVKDDKVATTAGGNAGASPRSGVDQEYVPFKMPTIPKCGNELDNSKAWKAIARALVAVESPKKHNRENIAPLIEKANAQTQLLIDRGVLSNAEGKLFLEALDDLYSEVPSAPPPPRPKGTPQPTCYAPRPSPDQMATNSISTRVPLLEALATNKALHPAVLCRIVGHLAKDLNQAEALRRLLVEEMKRDTSERGVMNKKLVDDLNRSIALLQELNQRLIKLNTGATGR